MLSFEKLEIYHEAANLADTVCSEGRTWRQFEKQTIGQQLCRAADSIGANIAEGAGRGDARDQARFVRIARGSLYETEYWISRAEGRGIMKCGVSIRLTGMVSSLALRLNGYLAYLRRKGDRTT
jgi:four helix bundle protein